MPETLDIKVEAEKLRKMYQARQSEQLICALVIGDTGSGKTRLLETCRRPIHIDSFDPKGTETVRRGIQEGWIITDTRFELEDPTDPSAFELWDAEYNRRKEGGYFSQLGTYAIDSFTTLSDCVMNIVLKGLVRKADRADKSTDKRGRSISKIDTDFLKIPQENDWPLAQNILMNVLRDITTLPCDVVLTGHIEDKTKKKGAEQVFVGRGLYAIGKLMTRIPRIFEEVYVMKAEEIAGGQAHWLYTGIVDGIGARTRIGRDRFDYRETPDIMALLKKAGYDPKHKEIP